MRHKELHFYQNWGNIIKFNQILKMQKLLFIIYAHYKALNTKIDGTQPRHIQAYTEKTTIHAMSGFTYHIVSPYCPSKTVTYRV